MNPTLVLLAAGMSTRYGRLKQLEPVGPEGETLLDYAVFDAEKAGFSRVVLIIRPELEEAFRAHVEGRWPAGLEVVYHHQRLGDLAGADSELAGSGQVADLLKARRKPWGTAHALLTARERLSGPFVILNADDFYGAEAYVQAMEFLKAEGKGGDPVAPDAREGQPPTEVLPPMYAEPVGASLEVPSPTFTFGLVTYTLRDTLSDHGGVSRGVCEVDEEGWLERIREILKIQAVARDPEPTRGGDGREEGRGADDQGRGPAKPLMGETVAGDPVTLSGAEAISTNFWIFTPSVFPLLATGFRRFLGSALVSPADQQPEFLIPTVVNQAVRNRSIRVKAIPTAGRFLGITHPADRPWVVDGLETMTEEGRYPSPLWR